MQSVEQNAIYTYQNNMEYFAKSHPDLYKKMQTLEVAIETGQFPEKYELEYTNNYFDVKNKLTQTYLYGENSLHLAKKVAKQINYKKDDQVFETLFNFNFNDEAIKLISKFGVEENFYKGIAEIINYVNNNSTKQDLIKQIYKYLFLGVGLGLHLTEIDKKIQAYLYFIIEDDIELFRLSLFVTDYEKISHDSTLFFAISESGSTFNANITEFMSKAYIRNNYLKYFPFTNTYDQKIKAIQASIVSQPFRIYTYDRLMRKTLISLRNLKERYNFLDISTPHNNTIFSNKPVLFLAPGPSLSKNIDWLQEHHERFIIVTVFAALKILESISVSPDVIIHIDESGEMVKKMRNQLSSLDFIKKSIYIFTTSAPQEILDICNKKSTYLIQDITHYKKGFGSIQGHSVGEIGYGLMLFFGVHELYLLGLDLALDSTTGSSHSSDHHAPRNIDVSNLDTAEKVSSLNKTTIRIKGNFKDSVPTTALLYMSVHCVNTFTQVYKKQYQNVYNLSDGALFDNIPAMKAMDINTKRLNSIDKENLHIKIKDYFDSHSSNHLNQLDLDGIQSRINEANSVKDAIILHSQLNFPNSDIYNKAFVNLLSVLINTISSDRPELPQIFTFYTKSISGYLTDFFNTKGVKNTKRHIKIIDKILVSTLLDIVNVYLDMLIKVNED